MNLTRRSLFASAVALFVASKVKRVAAAIGERLPARWKTVVTVGKGGDCRTLAEAMARVPEGGVIYLLPGMHEHPNSVTLGEDPQ